MEALVASVAMGFRASPELHSAVSNLAKDQKRSMGNVLTLLVQEQMNRVADKGFDSIFYKEEKDHEQKRTD